MVDGGGGGGRNPLGPPHQVQDVWDTVGIYSYVQVVQDGGGEGSIRPEERLCDKILGENMLSCQLFPNIFLQAGVLLFFTIF